MTKIDLPGVNAVRAKGRWYYYYGRGQGASKLPGLPGSLEFMAAYDAARMPKAPRDKHKLRAWVALFRSSTEFLNFSDSTQRVWRTYLRELEESTLAQLSIAAFDAPRSRVAIRKWRDTWRDKPRKADYAKQVLSRVLSYCVAEGMLRSNPCNGIPNLYSNDRADLIWTDNQIAALLRVASKEVSFAVQLAAWTGLRKGDLLTLNWSNIFESHIEIGTSKSRGRVEAVIPLLPECKRLLKVVPRVGEVVLTNSRKQPWRSFDTEWNKAMHKSGLKASGLHFHDLRGTFATRVYLAGVETKAIAQIMGWSVEKVERIMERYVGRNANMLRLAGQITKTRRRTNSAKLSAKLFA